ncbi:hypothetical protein ORI20_01830 [Mycobacterium sp. CVI_P3]|uniref:DUF4232 domain-containing protein n=1 Tax=Mycobacterium pinniadriaticum TaxID=2994102 RepID=A0ABT3S6K9_9MYCO|nr:hypothetical protein [Mycobacterium pinniadriaticum]MCX2928997.1 hypothetical protein [Mycobacterium pinniadriaticum]MCX2935136.1 hypothetical protein [Mycobacterium pinniadriaticum]
MLDLEPRGPLPSQIYWRRRGLAIGIVAVVAAIVVGVAFVIFSGSSDSKSTVKTTTAAGPQNPQPENRTPVIEPTTPAPAAGPVPVAPTPTEAVVPPPVLQEGDDCPDSNLAVKGITNQPQYVIGDQPKFTMVVTNIGLVACKRDVGAAVLAAYVYSLDGNRLWSNLDCAPSNETLVKTFNPGEQVTTEVTWTGMGSAPQCPLPRQPIGPGTYNLVVQLGNLRSASVPFILADAPPPGAAPAAGEQVPEAVPGEAPAPAPAG